MAIVWKDKNGIVIKAGDRIMNVWNNPPVLDVLTDGAHLFLGDLETIFSRQYGFHEFWEVVK